MTDELSWVQRNEIIWHKTNVMPYSGKDRFTVDFEPIYFFSKNPKYSFNQQTEPAVSAGQKRGGGRKYSDDDAAETFRRKAGGQQRLDRYGVTPDDKNKRTTWAVGFEPSKDKHFASYPTKLIEPMLLAGSSEGDIVLDPFSGTGTTGLVALRHARKYIGLELNPEYIEISKRKIK